VQKEEVKEEKPNKEESKETKSVDPAGQPQAQ
jgi:hypothetical protein